MRTAIIYDRVNKWGGAERVLMTLHEIFPNAPLYTAVYDKKKALWAKVFPKVIPSFLQKIPFMQDKHEFLGLLTPIAFETFSFDDYELVISVTSEAAKGIITKPKTLHLTYCLTPTRYLWSHYDTYFRGRSFKAITKPIVEYLRSWDRIAGQRPDKIIAISKEVKERIKKYYSRNAEIIYPPVDVDKIKNLKVRSNMPVSGKFYLLVSRMVPYKRIDLAINAFNKMKLQLVVVGTGHEEYTLKKIAHSNIKFLGFVKDGELISLYKRAEALIFPQDEDFGITAVEAQAAGCPVIAFKSGGALDIVVDGKTGIFFESQNAESLIGAVKNFIKIRTHIHKKDCMNNSERFSKDRFKNEFSLVVENLTNSKI